MGSGTQRMLSGPPHHYLRDVSRRKVGNCGPFNIMGKFLESRTTLHTGSSWNQTAVFGFLRYLMTPGVMGDLGHVADMRSWW